MNNTITLSQLITRLAKATGVDNNTARHFLRTFFATIEESLENGESVTVKNVGVFRIAEDAEGRRKLAFVPDGAMREEINKPFGMFEAVELAPDVDFVEMSENSENSENPEPKAIPEITPTEPSEPAPQQAVTEEAEGPIYHFAEEDEEDEGKEKVPEPSAEIHEEHQHKSRFWIWCAVIIAVVAVGAWLAAVYTVPVPKLYEDEEEEEIAADTVPDVVIEEVEVGQPAEAESKQDSQTAKPKTDTPSTPVAAAPKAEKVEKPQTSDKAPVYDIVSVSLIRLAKKHYGVAEYWVFIFDANRDIIKNPNTIRPGTRVLIPERSSLPGSTKAETRAIAVEKQSEYQRKYNR